VKQELPKIMGAYQDHLRKLLEQQLGKKIAPWVNGRLLDFQRMDRHSDVFRYADPPPDGELWLDFHQLKAVMDRLVQAFEEQIARIERGRFS
jgi:hypothetical protein